MTHLGDRFSDGEVAPSSKGGGGVILRCGTEDVLTCHVIVLHHGFTQVTALAHFDEFVQQKGLEKFVRSVQARSVLVWY